jgi:hypothetical protein
LIEPNQNIQHYLYIIGTREEKEIKKILKMFLKSRKTSQVSFEDTNYSQVVEMN